MCQLIFSCLKGCFWTPLNPWNASQRCKELYGVVHQHLSHSWHWISFIIRSFWGAKKEDHLGVISINRIKCSVGNFRVDHNWNITTLKKPGNCLILENCERSEYNFLLFLAQEFKFLKELAVQPECWLPVIDWYENSPLIFGFFNGLKGFQG